MSKETVGCIGKCTSGLTAHELDQITDNVVKTLAHKKGRIIFKNFIEQRDMRDNIKCLELYEKCSAIIEEKTKSSRSGKEFESLIEETGNVKEMIVFLDGVPSIDAEILNGFNEALKNPSWISLLDLLEKTKVLCSNHLSDVHKSFKEYASEPCPLKNK